MVPISPPSIRGICSGEYGKGRRRERGGPDAGEHGQRCGTNPGRNSGRQYSLQRFLHGAVQYGLLGRMLYGLRRILRHGVFRGGLHRVRQRVQRRVRRMQYRMRKRVQRMQRRLQRRVYRRMQRGLQRRLCQWMRQRMFKLRGQLHRMFWVYGVLRRLRRRMQGLLRKL